MALVPVASTQLDAALLEFQQALEPEQRLRLKQQSTVPTAASVLTFTAELDRENAKQGTRCVASRLSAILASVQQFTGVVDAFVSSNPNTAALIWGSLRFVLLLASNTASYFDKLSAFLMNIGRDCPRFTEYELIFDNSLRLQTALCNFYATLVECCTHTFRVFQKSGWLNLVRSAWSPFETEFGPLKSKIEDRAREVREEIALASNTAAHQARKSVSSQLFDIKSHMQRGSLTSADAQKRSLIKEQRRAKARRTALLDKFSSHNYQRPLLQARRKRYGEIGQWMIDDRQVRSWISDTGSSTLWFSGKLGSGKTVLASKLFDHLLLHPSLNYAKKIYFFCRLNDKASVNAETIIRCLIRQLIDPDTMPLILEEMLAKISSDSVELDELVAIFLSAFYLSSKPLFIIIDGTDECSGPERTRLFSTLKEMIKRTNAKIKLFLSSRNFSPPSNFSDMGKIYALATDTKNTAVDIENYVEAILCEKLLDGSFTAGSPDLIKHVQDALIDRAQGMFLWVTLQIEEICRQPSDDSVRKVIEQLPKDLTETYLRILYKIREQHYSKKLSDIERFHTRNTPRDVFEWVAMARRPLTILELQEALAVEPHSAFSNPERFINDMTIIPDLCGGLITVDEQDFEVQFTHPSVREVLMSSDYQYATSEFYIEETRADTKIGVACVTYLNFNDFKTQVALKAKVPELTSDKVLQASLAPVLSPKLAKAYQKMAQRTRAKSNTAPNFAQALDRYGSGAAPNSSGPQHPFLSYASTYWILHTASIDTSSRVWKPWESLLAHGMPHVQLPWTVEQLFGVDQEIGFWIARTGHVALLIWLQIHRLEFKVQRDQPLRSVYRSILVSAIMSDSIAVVEYLCTSKGRCWLDCDIAMDYAARYGSMKVANLFLVDWKWDVEKITPSNLTLLQTAAKHGQVNIVRQLLDGGAEVDKNFEGETIYGRHIPLGTPLYLAAEGGYGDVIDCLVSHGANVNAQPTRNQRSAIQAAVAGGHLEAVRSLYSGGAEINNYQLTADGRTPIQEATEGNHVEVVQYLIDNGANVNAAPSSQGRTALQIASGHGYEQLVDILLAAGADLNAEPAPYEGRSALQAAAEHGHIDVIRKLLDAGARVDGPKAINLGMTAIEAANCTNDVKLTSFTNQRGIQKDTYLPEGLFKNGNREIERMLMGID